MKSRNASRILFVLLGFIIALLAGAKVSAQIRLNEIEVDTPNSGAEPCEYIEVAGPPNTTVPADVFFLSIDGDSGQLGFVDYIANLGGLKFGSNGTITIVSKSDTCFGRNFPRETKLVQVSSIAMGFGAETFLLAKSANPKKLFEGQDLDVNDDGVLDASLGLTPIDGIAWIVDSGRNKTYGGAPVIFKGTEWPDAATRFKGEASAFKASAWYYGEVAPPENSTSYKGPLSSNFPQGGKLTPGAPNVGTAQPSRTARN